MPAPCHSCPRSRPLPALPAQLGLSFSSPDMMERALINTFVGHDVVEPGNYVQMFPYPCYTRDE